MLHRELSHSTKSSIFIICCGIFAGFILKLFVIDFFRVSGRSMEPAIHDSSMLVVNKLSYGIIKPWSNHLLIQWKKPKVDDVVIYLYNNKIVVKRVLSTERQLLEYSDEPLYTLKAGEKIVPLTENQYKTFKDIQKVPEGYVLAIGDNYEESMDSRDYGFVSVKNVLGKVLCK
ncbi:signal peptidase I [Treponema pectinovorum]|uniref:signal peptidase I n=1 Tax=Treponema pectinovorum TaxID=164 RepID=UPI003D8DE2AE